MLSKIFVLFYLLFVNLSICSSHNIFNIYTKSNDSFYQDDDPQNPVNIHITVNNNDCKEVDIKKFLKFGDDNTVDPNNTNQLNTTTIQNKDKEVEKVPKVHDDYTLYSGHGYYKYHNNTVTWHVAKHICEQEGSHLAVLNSQAEANLILAITKTTNYTPVGFHGTATSKNFVTVLGGQLSGSGFVKWYPSFPVTNSSYDCGYLWHDGTFVNYPCTWTYPFVCEK